jgi:hypothetical protein
MSADRGDDDSSKRLAAVASRLPPQLRTPLRRLVRGSRFGQLRRTQPFATDYGYSRGTPVDRVYIERFLEANASLIRGDVLEVKDDGYTRRFGGTRVSTAHVVDIDPTNARATIVGDLAVAGTLPADGFDCVVLTQVVQFIEDIDAALANVWASLRSGGSLLVTVPTTTMTLPELGPEGDYWRFTSGGLATVLRRTCPGGEVVTEGDGNVLAAVAFLMGLPAEELRPEELGQRDRLFEIVACGRARKA